MLKLKSILLLGCLLLGLSASAFSQSQPNTSSTSTPVASSPDVQLLRAILEELRLQRAALQRAYINAYRAQMLTERLARQQARVDSLNEEIAQLKALIQQAQDTSRDEDDLRELETQIGEVTDPQERARLLRSYAALKRSLERERALAKQEAEKSYGRQMQLENTLRAEQAKLAELQSQLEELDRELEKLATTENKARR